MYKRVSVFIIIAALLCACATVPKSKTVATRTFECGWPGFTVTYPGDWVAMPFQPELGQVFRSGNTSGLPVLTVSVSAHQGRPLKYYSRALLPALSTMGRDFEITKDQTVVLKDGTSAWETRLNWVVNSGASLTTLFLTVPKEEMWITTSVTNRMGEMTEELQATAYSLAVDPKKEELVEVPADIRRFLDDYAKAIADHDLDQVMTHFSDQYLSYGRKKSDFKLFFRKVIDLVPSYEIVTTSFQNSGDTATVAGYAVIAGGKFAIPGYHLKKNDAGKWQMYGNQQM